MLRPITIAMMLVLVATVAGAQPSTVSYQGSLHKGTGAVKPAYEGTAQFRFAILCGGQIVWNSDAASAQTGDPLASLVVEVTGGTFAVRLGDPGLGMPALTAAVLDGCSTPMLRVWVDTGEGVEQLPDQPFSSSAFALQAESGGSDTDWEISGNDVYRLNGRVGIGTSSPQHPLQIDVPGSANDGIFLAKAGTSLGSGISVRGSNNQILMIDIDPNAGSGYEQFEIWYNGNRRVMIIDRYGNVGIGDDHQPSAKLDVAGTARTQVLEITGGADLAEPFDVRAGEPIEAGMVVCIDPHASGALRLANRAYDPTVAGVVSGANGINPGLTLRQEGSEANGTHPVSLTGRVYAWADADGGGPIVPGDLLTTSDTAGHAMRVGEPARANGAILGKAMTGLEAGRGLVLILVSLQ